MIAGHLRKRYEKYHIDLSWYKNKKRDTILIGTGLSAKEKANTKIAEDMLAKARLYFQPEMKYNNEMLTVFKESVLGIKVKKKKKIIQPPIDVDLTEKITGDMLFSTFIMRWLLMIKKDIRKTTFFSYEQNITKRIVPYFQKKGILLKDLTADDIQEFYNYVSSTYGIKNNTILKYHANIRKALEYAYKTDKIPFNPADKIERPKKEEYIASYYSKEELQELLEAIRGDVIEIPVLLAAFYGLRRSEIIGLRWDAVNFQNDTITIRHTVMQYSIDGKYQLLFQDIPKSKSGYRILPLSPYMKKVLTDTYNSRLFYQKVFKDSYNKTYKDYVCINKNGDLIKPGYVTQHFKVIISKNGLKKITPHGLRHTCATILYDDNARDSDVQRWLGHSDIHTTMSIYVHNRSKPDKHLSDIMENIINIDNK